MGKLIFSQWARLIGLTAGSTELLGGGFGLIYRLSMFEPIVPGLDPLFNPFNIVAVLCIVFGLIIMAVEYPIKPFQKTFIVTAHSLKCFMFFIFGFISIFNYQNVTPALFMFFNVFLYAKASSNGEGKHSSTGTSGKV